MPTPPPTTERGPTPERTPAPVEPARTPSTPASTTAPPETVQPLTLESAQRLISSKAPGESDIAGALAREAVAGRKTTEQFEAEVVQAGLQRRLIDAYVKDPSAGSVKSRAQVLGAKDPIAVQKFADIDGEAHLEAASVVLKTTYYNDLIAKMRDPVYTDRSRTFEIMKGARGHNYCFKGKKLPASRLTKHSTRNQTVSTFYSKNIIAGDIDAEIATQLAAAGVTDPAAIARQKADPEMRKKAYRHILASGKDPMSTVSLSGNITDWGTWYHPGEISPSDFSGHGDTDYQKMMRLGALQPEWYPEGTVVLTIDTALSTRTREARKPTCFDGLLSALWTSRNVGADDYGMTGGGAAEFLETNVSWAEVTSARAVIPSDAFIADIQRAATQVQNAMDTPELQRRRAMNDASVAAGGRATEFVPEYTATAERVRGNNKTTSILNTTVGGTGVRGMYDDVVSDTTRQHNATGNGPTVPGAPTPNAPGSAAQTTPAAASGGAFDTRSAPRAGANATDTTSTQAPSLQ